MLEFLYSSNLSKSSDWFSYLSLIYQNALLKQPFKWSLYWLFSFIDHRPHPPRECLNMIHLSDWTSKPFWFFTRTIYLEFYQTSVCPHQSTPILVLTPIKFETGTTSFDHLWLDLISLSQLYVLHKIQNYSNPVNFSSLISLRLL